MQAKARFPLASRAYQSSFHDSQVPPIALALTMTPSTILLGNTAFSSLLPIILAVFNLFHSAKGPFIALIMARPPFVFCARKEENVHLV